MPRGYPDPELGLRVEVDPAFGCWLWPTEQRYGQSSIGEVAHRWVWKRLRGPLPAKVELDHMCRRTRCVNPAHMDPVSRAENMRRTLARYRRGIERCPEGHRFDEFGAPTPEGGIICRVCTFGS